MTDHKETDETILAADFTPSETKAGFVALIGAPNAGKSTLMLSLIHI